MHDQFTEDGGISFDDVGAGPHVLVLLHAFPLSRLMWRRQLEALAPDCRVIAPDLRGFGGSRGFDGPPSVDQMADDVAALLDELRIPGPVVVGGLSMGGYVALAFARRHAARLAGLILADTKADADDAAARARRTEMSAFAAVHPAGAVLEKMLPTMLSTKSGPDRLDVVALVRDIGKQQVGAGVAAALLALRDRPDANDLLPKLKVPVLVLVGEDDQLTPPATAAAMAAKIPGAECVTIPAAGHLSNLEQPELFNAAVASFLRRRL